MDIAIIKEIVVEVGAPVAITIIALWIAIDVYRTIKSDVKKHLEKQSDASGLILKAVEAISHSSLTTSIALADICAVVKDNKSILEEMRDDA